MAALLVYCRRCARVSCPGVWWLGTGLQLIFSTAYVLGGRSIYSFVRLVVP